MPRFPQKCAVAAVLLFSVLARAEPAPGSPAVVPTPVGKEIVLFPFDDESIPFRKGLNLTLIPGRKSPSEPGMGADRKHPGKPVLAIGRPGDPDSKRVYFFGSMLKVDGEYRMWYSGHDGHRRQLCYATSRDGLSWEKPKLGLVEYEGRKENNLLSLDGGTPMKAYSALVIHDPADPDPARRFKMIREVDPTRICAAVSADGLSWTSINGNEGVIKGSSLEPSGFIRRDGLYILNGHGGPVPHPIAAAGDLRPQKRMMVTLVSYDFEHWTEAGHVSFRRDNVPPRPILDFEFHRGEQVHLGASLWDRGNVVLGFYGQYHNPTNDRRTCFVDIGLLVGGDGIHFREPVPDFKIVPSFEEPDRAEPRLTQGQAFANIGSRSILYYGIWTEVDRNSPTGVRIATWPRDRFGFFAPAPTVENAHCLSAPVTIPRAGSRVFVNATGLADDSQLTVELTDEQFRPLPGFSAADFIPFKEKSGYRLAAAWRGGDRLNTLQQAGHPIRIRVNWSGVKQSAARLYALYVE